MRYRLRLTEPSAREIQSAVDAFVDPWEEADQPYHANQFRSDLIPVESLVGSGRTA